MQYPTVSLFPGYKGNSSRNVLWTAVLLGGDSVPKCPSISHYGRSVDHSALWTRGSHRGFRREEEFKSSALFKSQPETRLSPVRMCKRKPLTGARVDGLRFAQKFLSLDLFFFSEISIHWYSFTSNELCTFYILMSRSLVLVPQLLDTHPI